MQALECVQCGRRSDPAARAWKAFIAGDDEEAGEDDEGVEVIVFCPSCAAREFGCR